ncbi:ABC transporter, ATP-binding protein [Mageeibacillus indolicus UPII9-5]|uniref:ABC transporter, ATP-binding protein n=1 Tax=Mageeibacillus indolicus (strain UPII9-5) TaxID=699246 RepID=D3R055_MAGIU|nr:ABC transporter ATP-binding protein [Mageeibacillus indolicus]ADC91105.1 ABC transporter, ATP-binding protein [Mageeibacillus indolicus UPII9-5]
MNLLEVKNLYAGYGAKEVLHGLSFDLRPGEVLCIVGESGSGKSTLLKAVINAALTDFYYRGEIRRNSDFGVVFQNPFSSFNPTNCIWTHFKQLAHSKSSLRSSEIKNRAVHLLETVGLKDAEELLHGYSYEMSGGMLQRISIAMALFFEPGFIVADEPTSALDMGVRNMVMKEFSRIKAENRSILLVTHDMRVVEKIADRVMVIFGGHILEAGSQAEVIGRPIHPYTKALLGAVPKFNEGLPAKVSYNDFDYGELQEYLLQPDSRHYVAPWRIVEEN